MNLLTPLSRRHHADARDELVTPAGREIDQPHEGPDVRQFPLDVVHEGGQDEIDGEEVVPQGRQVRGAAGLGGGDAEIQIDVGAHAQHQVLQDDRRPTVERHERDPPGTRRFLAGAMAFHRVEITIGEDHVQPLHAGAILEPAVLDAAGHVHGDPAIQRGEVSKPTGVLLGPGHDPVEGVDDPGDRLGSQV